MLSSACICSLFLSKSQYCTDPGRICKLNKNCRNLNDYANYDLFEKTNNTTNGVVVEGCWGVIERSKYLSK